MVTGHGHTDVCYNVQTAVDSKHKLIVEHEVTNDVTDQGHLSEMALRAKETLHVEQMEVVADMGYFDGAEVKKCVEAGITPYIAKPETSANKKQGLFTKEEFRYEKQRDCYICPQGEELNFRFETTELGRRIRDSGDSSMSRVSTQREVHRQQRRQKDYALGIGALAGRNG